MQSIQLQTHIGEDGILKVKLPSNVENQEIEVMIIFQPVKDKDISPIETEKKKLSWQEFIEKTAGSCADDPIVLDDLGIDETLDDNLEEIISLEG
jgi:hypothetical protein